MKKAGLVALVLTFLAFVGTVAAQTASPSPTATPSPTASPTTPTGAPATGFGGY